MLTETVRNRDSQRNGKSERTNEDRHTQRHARGKKVKHVHKEQIHLHGKTHSSKDATDVTVVHTSSVHVLVETFKRADICQPPRHGTRYYSHTVR